MKRDNKWPLTIFGRWLLFYSKKYMNLLALHKPAYMASKEGIVNLNYLKGAIYID